MRMVVVVVALVMLAVPAHANDKALKPYVGKLVISPDVPPPTSDQLPGFLKANLTKDARYELIKGPPWPFHLVAVLGKDTKQVTLVVADKADAKLAPLLSIDLTPTQRLVIAHTEATVSAGFAAGKTYVVRLLAGKTQLAKSDLTLRP